MVILIDEDAHLCKKFHLLLVQIIRVYFRHPCSSTQIFRLSVNSIYHGEN